jgi:hypothetical protein
MVVRGNGILEGAFGKEGWRRRAETMRAEKARWWSLSAEKRRNKAAAEHLAYDQGIPLEEAYLRIDADPLLRQEQLAMRHFLPYAHLPEAVGQIKRRS